MLLPVFMQSQPPTSVNNPKMTALIIVFEIHQTVLSTVEDEILITIRD